MVVNLVMMLVIITLSPTFITTIVMMSEILMTC